MPRNGQPLSEETRRKISEARTRRLVFDHHPSRLSYSMVHRLMRRFYPKVGRCEWCGSVRRTEYAVARFGFYTLNRADWLELCSRCHTYFDERGFRDGHAHSEETRRKLSEIASRTLKGRPVSLETRMKISAAKRALHGAAAVEEENHQPLEGEL